MVQYGMKPLDVLKADLLNGAKLLDWDRELGALKPGYDPTSSPSPAIPSTISAYSSASPS